jgi:hypothetical protein
MSFEDNIPSDVNVNEELSLGFEEARDFDSLYDMIRQLGEITGTAKTYTADELIKEIERVRHGHRETAFITRSFRIRETVERLLPTDRVYKKYVTDK